MAFLNDEDLQKMLKNFLFHMTNQITNSVGKTSENMMDKSC